MLCRGAGASCVVLFVGACAQAVTVDFTFPDPTNYPTFVHQAGPGATPGSLTSSKDDISLLVDLTNIGLAPQMYDGHFEFSATVGAAVPNAFGSSAPLSAGFFEFTLTQRGGGGSAILSGTFTGGEIVAAAGAGAAITTSGLGLTYTASGELAALLAGAGYGGFSGFADAVFTLTNVLPPFAINQFGYYESFTANSAYSGTATVIPLPTGAGLAGVGLGVLALGGMTVRRRRA